MMHAPKRIRPNQVIRASAGSGKTFQLTNRFIALLNLDQSADQILATTFTRKAAGEILARILERLAKAATDEGSRAKLATFLDDESLTNGRCLELLRRLTGNLHRLRVSTLDSFFAQLAGSFSLELELPPGWQIVDELVDERLRMRAIESVLDGESPEEITRLMNLLSKGEAERSVGDMIRSTVDGLYAQYLETDPQAWQHVPRRKQLPEPKLAAALAALLQAPLPENKHFEKAREKDYGRAEQGDWESFLESGLAKPLLKGQTTYYKKEIPREAQAAYQAIIDHAGAVLLDQLANQTEATFKLLEKFDEEYGRLKFDHGALRFDDVTHRLGAGRELGGSDGIAFRMDGRIGHLLLDEFQDTSLAQWQAIRPFAERITADERHRGTFFCVGDTKQAIYGWRGGVAEIFDALGTDLDGIEEDHLEKSYRSSQPVIDTVNAVFTQLDRHNNLGDLEQPIQRWCDRFIEHETDRSKLPGYVTLETARLADDDENHADATLEFAADRVAELVQQASEATIGVLVIKNKAVARLIYELHQRDVPASEEGGNPLTDSAAVQLILSLLRLADHPGDTVARFHVAHSALGRHFDLNADTTDEEVANVARRLRAELLADGYGAAVRRWAERLVADCSSREVSRLRQLIEQAYQYQPSATLRPNDFVQVVVRKKIADPATAAVRVMTVHQAKGLEFDIVVLPEFDGRLLGQADPCVVGRDTPTGPVTDVCLYRNETIRALLPPRMQQMFVEHQERKIAEAMCVLYVALTRAVHALHVVIAPSGPREKKLHKTYAGLLRAALVGKEPAPESTVLYEHGNPRWFLRDTDDKEEATPPEKKTRLEPLAVKLAPFEGQRRRGLQTASPSQLEGGTSVQVSELFRRDRTTAFNVGSIVHAWFEQIDWLEEGVPDDEALRQIAAGYDTTGVDVDELVGRFHAMLDREIISESLSKSAYDPPSRLSLGAEILTELAAGPLEMEVCCEQSIVTKRDGTLFTGKIDRLVLLQRGGRLSAVEVIDFKTDVFQAGDQAALNKKTEFYRPQIETYRQAVASMYRIDPERIAGRLLFVSAGGVVNL